MPHSLKARLGNLRYKKIISDKDYDRLCKALEQEPKTAHWIIHPKGIYAHLICDKCLSNAPYDCKTNYCPNCGAKMESEEKDAT